MPNNPFISTLQKWIEVSVRISMRHLLHYSRQSGLSMSHLGALFHIHHIKRCGVTDLGDHLGVTSAAASQMLERLVQQGFILRSEDPKDRRVKQIVLTDKGHQILDEGIHARQGWLEDLEHTLTDPEKASVIRTLNLLIERVNQMTQVSIFDS